LRGLGREGERRKGRGKCRFNTCAQPLILIRKHKKEGERETWFPGGLSFVRKKNRPTKIG